MLRHPVKVQSLTNEDGAGRALWGTSNIIKSIFGNLCMQGARVFDPSGDTALKKTTIKTTRFYEGYYDKAFQTIKKWTPNTA